MAADGFVYQWWPRLTPDGMKLIFKSGAQIQQMATDTLPVHLPLPVSTSTVITSIGGDLYSEIDTTGVGHGAAISGTLCLWWMDVNGWVRLPSGTIRCRRS